MARPRFGAAADHCRQRVAHEPCQRGVESRSEIDQLDRRDLAPTFLDQPECRAIDPHKVGEMFLRQIEAFTRFRDPFAEHLPSTT